MFGSKENKDLKGIEFCGYKGYTTANRLSWFNNFNVVIGRNNSGKTAFIDIVHALCDPDFLDAITESSLSLSIVNKAQHYTLYGSWVHHPGLTEDEKEKNFEKYLNKDLRIGVHATDSADRGKEYEYYVVDDKTNGVDADLNVNYKIEFDPYAGFVFRKIASERDIVPEKEVKDFSLPYISENGEGASRYVAFYDNTAGKNDFLICKDVLKVLNYIVNADGRYVNIKTRHNEKQEWEIWLEDESGVSIPISKMGSGIKTILLVLLNLIVIPHEYDNSNFVFAFEELENNLHPALEKRLYSFILEYAREKGYIVFLTSHSSVAIDLLGRENDVDLYKTWKDDQGSHIERLDDYNDYSMLLDELGIKASDILQSNGLIWVEGPSDRIYIKNWLEKFYPGEFAEERDYQFIYYGGKLLAQYSATDKYSNDNLINILSINRNAYLVMDSDKASDSDVLAKRKVNMIAGMEKNGIHYWVTEGREIENYLDVKIGRTRLGKFEKLENRFKNKIFNKIDFAKQHWSEIREPDEVKSKIDEIAADIHKWNM